MARNRHWSFGHQNNKRYWYVRVELRNTWNSPFKSVLWSYALMAAAISLLCSLGFYVARCCFRFSCAYFSQQIFFRKLSRESDNSVREYRSEITKNIQLQVWICFTLERNCSNVVNAFQKKLWKVSTVPKEIGHEEPCYNTKISFFSFNWAGLAAFHKASTI